jgi:predicted secreted hydrolase
MDHEFGSRFYEKTQTGWDWLSIQLDDGRELMFYQLRRPDGSLDPHSSGTLIDQDGRATHLAFGEFSLKPTATTWHSEASNATYPIVWTIDVPKVNLRLEARAAFAAQELRTTQSTGVIYWEGSINVAGRSAGLPLGGRGYLEMTGYSGQNMGAIFQ